MLDGGQEVSIFPLLQAHWFFFFKNKQKYTDFLRFLKTGDLF